MVGLGKYYSAAQEPGSDRSKRRKGAPGLDLLDDEVDDDDDEDEEERDEEDDGEVKGGAWAIRDVSFSLARGQSIGITGPAGCGKSTLIKILGRRSRPTEGKAVLRGDVVTVVPSIGPLLRGHHSVRKNVVLAARFLGVSDDRVAKRIDDIAAFAGLTSRLDRPVRQLTREQLQRLTYSVTFHLGAGILLADEVLAGGDPDFRERCFDLVREQRSEGLTLVYATHNPVMLREMCDIGLLLDNGRVVAEGAAADIAAEWETQAKRDRLMAAPKVETATEPPPPEPVVRFAVYGLDGRVATRVASSEAIVLELIMEIEEAPLTVRCGVLVEHDGSFSKVVQPDAYTAEVAGRQYASLYIAPHTLPPGTYVLRGAVFVQRGRGHVMLGDAPGVCSVEVVGDAEGATEQPGGLEKLEAVWSIRPASVREALFDDVARTRPDADSRILHKQQLATARRAAMVMREARRGEGAGRGGAPAPSADGEGESVTNESVSGQ